MPISMYWANEEKTLVHLTSTGQWTWDEYLVADGELRSILDSVDHTVTILSDVRDLVVPSDIISRFPRLRKGAVLVHPNVGINVIVVSSRLLLSLLQTFLRLYKIEKPRQIMVSTYEEAERIVAAYIRQDDPHPA